MGMTSLLSRAKGKGSGSGSTAPDYGSTDTPKNPDDAPSGSNAGDSEARTHPPPPTTPPRQHTVELTPPDGEMQDARDAKRQIGIPSATLLILNRIIGTGIFATPGSILALSGSVGLSLIIWVAGMIIAAAGMAVYLEFGTAIPKNGGEKN